MSELDRPKLRWYHDRSYTYVKRLHPVIDRAVGVAIGIALIAFIAALVVGIIQLVSFVGHTECFEKYGNLDREVEYPSVWAGCLVEDNDGNLVPDDNLRFSE